jgi:hypothetical protein
MNNLVSRRLEAGVSDKMPFDFRLSIEVTNKFFGNFPHDIFQWIVTDVGQVNSNIIINSHFVTDDLGLKTLPTGFYIVVANKYTRLQNQFPQRWQMISRCGLQYSIGNVVAHQTFTFYPIYCYVPSAVSRPFRMSRYALHLPYLRKEILWVSNYLFGRLCVLACNFKMSWNYTPMWSLIAALYRYWGTASGNF